MSNFKYDKVKLQFLLYPLYTLICFIALLLFINSLVYRDYKVSFLGDSLSLIAWLAVTIGTVIAVMCNFVLHKKSRTISKKFFIKSSRFSRIIASLVAAFAISAVAYTWSPIAPIISPTMSDYDAPAENVLHEDLMALRQDVDYLVGTSNYSLLQDKFVNKNIEVGNSVFTLHEDSVLKSNIVKGKQTFIPWVQFNRVLAPTKSNTSFGWGKWENGYTNDDIVAKLKNVNPRSVLGYYEISNTQLNGYDNFSFSAELFGTTGQCFLLEHSTERIQTVTTFPEGKSEPKVYTPEGTKSEKFCIDNNSKSQFANKIFFKETYLSSVNRIVFWLVPEDGNNIDIEINRKSEVPMFKISNENFIGFQQAKELDYIPNPVPIFCIQGFHKGAPDSSVHLTEDATDVKVEKGGCPAGLD